MPEWPFSLAELTAGLRRYFAEPALQVRAVHAGPDKQGGQGLQVEYTVAGEALPVDCVLKQPQGTGRAGLAHPGVREAGLLRSLAGQLPLTTPALIAADPAGRWLVLEAVEAGATPAWDVAAYEAGIAALAGLHERFWGLSDDLAAYPWLARPLTLDYEIHVYAAAQALGQVVRDERPALIARSAQVLAILGQIISQADRVAAPLRALPFTLLHGNFWEGNTLRDEAGDLVVLDWQGAAIGPGMLDLVAMLAASRWERGRLPIPPEPLVARYRQEIARRTGTTWSDREWARLWDHALLWRFMQETLNEVLALPDEVFAARIPLFEAIWLRPVLAAAGRRLEPIFSP